MVDILVMPPTLFLEVSTFMHISLRHGQKNRTCYMAVADLMVAILDMSPALYLELSTFTHISLRHGLKIERNPTG